MTPYLNEFLHMSGLLSFPTPTLLPPLETVKQNDSPAIIDQLGMRKNTETCVWFIADSILSQNVSIDLYMRGFIKG